MANVGLSILVLSTPQHAQSKPDHPGRPHKLYGLRQRYSNPPRLWGSIRGTCTLNPYSVPHLRRLEGRRRPRRNRASQCFLRIPISHKLQSPLVQESSSVKYGVTDRTCLPKTCL
ncbi:hypothetical protein FA13DRAFT_1734176 [Coprinellus micaceus]|uniref:Uncharacterized protein n=1 Tax=Coprinellus micaceus TaxID=71717 RepID=A0A4Y7T6M7_COPMI|nr:hypothetical protein FA13DRAFT_1734176 [Coprinellus micaceus]